MSVDTLMGKIPNEVLEYIDKFEIRVYCNLE